MTKIKKMLSNPICFLFAVNVIVLLVSVFVFHPFFEENDDAFLAMLAEGAYGMREDHLIYVNAVLGKLLTGVYGLIPGIRWYSILQYLFLFAAYCIMTYLLGVQRKRPLLSFLLLLGTFYETYVSLQYTKTAAVVTAAGYLLLFEIVRIKKEIGRFPRLFFLPAYTLLLYGALLRGSAFLLASIPMLFVGLYEWHCFYRKEERKEFVKVFVPVFCVVALLFAADHMAYENDAEWKTFLAYNNTRMELLDYRYDLLDYSANGRQLEELGISENDALLYLTWQFGDDRVVTTEFMNNILDHANARSVDTKMLKEFLSHLFEEFYSLNALLPCLLGAVLLFLTAFSLKDGESRKKKGLFLYFAGNVFAVFLILFYYQYSGRWNHRVVYALLMTVLFAFFYEGAFCYDGQKEKVRAEMIIFAIALFFNIGLLLQNQFDYRSYLRTELDSKAQTALMQKEKEQLFVIDTFTFQNAYKYDVFTAYLPG
ncbi:MAG TPA: hypothetical protein PLU43_09725, partial [Lachnospiraceae bacterium]|nr:hypothetical protein [Lachnospiraceae bacterium]